MCIPASHATDYATWPKPVIVIRHAGFACLLCLDDELIPVLFDAAETAQVQASQMKTQQSWDQYVATQLSSAKDSTSQTKLVLTLEAELAQPGQPFSNLLVLPASIVH